MTGIRQIHILMVRQELLITNNNTKMKTLVILSVFAMEIGGYQYAFKDSATGQTGRMRLPERMSVGDTVIIDSLYRIEGYIPKR